MEDLSDNNVGQDEKPRHGRFKILLLVNILFLLGLIFYVPNQALLRLLHENDAEVTAGGGINNSSAEEEDTMSGGIVDSWLSPFLWLIGFAIIVLIVTFQLTLDFDILMLPMGRCNFDDAGVVGEPENTLHHLKLWRKVSIWFLLFSTTFFALTLFMTSFEEWYRSCTSSVAISRYPGPWLVSFLGLIIVTCRFLVISVGHHYISQLALTSHLLPESYEIVV